jgi:hypothetical protein
MLKEYVNEHFSHLKEMGNSQRDYDTLCDVIEQAWNALDQDKIDNLIRSMPRRINAVWNTGGWHSKY